MISIWYLYRIFPPQNLSGNSQINVHTKMQSNLALPKRTGSFQSNITQDFRRYPQQGVWCKCMATSKSPCEDEWFGYKTSCFTCSTSFPIFNNRVHSYITSVLSGSFTDMSDSFFLNVKGCSSPELIPRYHITRNHKSSRIFLTSVLYASNSLTRLDSRLKQRRIWCLVNHNSRSILWNFIGQCNFQNISWRDSFNFRTCGNFWRGRKTA